MFTLKVIMKNQHGKGKKSWQRQGDTVSNRMKIFKKVKAITET